MNKLLKLELYSEHAENQTFHNLACSLEMTATIIIYDNLGINYKTNVSGRTHQI